MTKEVVDLTTRANVFPRASLQGDGLLYNPPGDAAARRPKPAPVVNIHKEYESTQSYLKTRQTIKEIITQHKAKALSNQERYEREEEAEKYKTTFLETRLATTGVPTLNTISVVMERRRAQGEARMKGLANDTPTKAESIRAAMHQAYGSGKLDLKALEIDTLPDALASTFILQMARFITDVNISRNEFRELSRQFCDSFPGCHVLNASENSIMSMAPEISRWSNLMSLVLDSNRLDAVPDLLPTTLTSLSVARNRLAELPYIYRLTSLTNVDVSHNQLTVLPNAMYELKFLRTFNAARNKLLSAGLLPLPSFKSRHAAKAVHDDDLLDAPGHRAKDWSERLDPLTNMPVYFNNVTKAITRVRPAVLGQAKPTHQAVVILPKLQLPNATHEPDAKAIEPHATKEGWEITMGLPTRYTNHATSECFDFVPKELDRYDAFAHMHRLNLSSNEIQELPASIGEMYQLEILQVDHNQLSTLPESICQLKNLTTLHMGSNYLTSLPKQFPLIPMLRELDMKLNRVAHLPADIGMLRSLTHLDVSGNALVAVPPSVLQLTHLNTFNVVGNPNLKVPSASSQKNGIHAIFWEIKHQIHIDAKGMPPVPHQVTTGIADECVTTDIHVHKEFLRLVDEAKTTGVLDFHWRNLAELPFQLFDVTTLTELRLTGHVLGRVPVEISSLTSLRLLTLRRNQLTEFHPDCVAPSCIWEELDCENNQLALLPYTLTQCSKLRVLRMGCNVLETLPSDMDALVQLEQCLVPHNHLTALPSGLARIATLKLLDVSNNAIEQFSDFDFASLTSLVDFKANLNLLSDLPASIAHSNLLDLSLSGNRFTVYPLVATQLKCIRRIWMQANKFAELPVEFGHLRTLEAAEFDGNPLRSPPPDILAQGVEAIREYLQKRIDRVAELKKLLMAAQYGFHENHFTPQSHDLLHSGILFLLPEDLVAFDKVVDHYINGPFYEHPDVRGVDLVQGLVALQFQRSQASRRAVLEDLLRLCLLIQSKRWLDKVEFRYDLTRPWGYGAEATPVFMVDPKALYEDWEEVPGILSVIKKRVERGFQEEAFNHTREVVEDALINYKGVYGPVGLATDKVPFRCGCEELLRKNTQHDPCYRFGWVLVQMLITREEAERRQREQEHLTQALGQVRTEIEAFCMNSRDGKARLFKEAKLLKADRKNKVKAMKKQVPHIKRKIELRKSDLDIAIRKHALDKATTGEGWIEQDEKQAIFVEEDIKEDMARLTTQIDGILKMQAKIKHELRQDYNHYVAEVVDKLLEEAGAEVRQKIITNHRVKAIRKQYRRPWDGPNGFDFHQFKQQYLGLPPLETPRDNSSVSEVSGDFDDYANLMDDDSDEPLPSIEYSSVSEDEPVTESGKNEVADVLKNDAAEADDSDDSDV
ncbi:Aste57867_8290 [Aphanomyces stellatus]|uniref:Aste57867_8290 protein n=1 Tax=Aphanomyces stellatus TaxID=120398 RepID=A0A485KJX1_9STRA|nr:hypothetical protein As57867_008259 [Aphanomyces stellatus]VFT85177.1 Aste57867_8290 [Aphanomyces stellatus]